MGEATSDLNNLITTAVNARIETSILEALSGDQFIGKMVSTALNQVVEVQDPRTYSRRKTTFLAQLMESTIQGAVKEAARRLVAEESKAIEDAVRKELRSSSADIAKQLVGSVTDAAKNTYGIDVSLKFPSR